MKKYITAVLILLIFIVFLNILHLLHIFDYEETYLIKKKNHKYPNVRLPASPSRVKRRT